MENKADRTSRVLELRKGLEKGLDSGEFGVLDDILAELSRTAVDVALLKATAIGVAVNRARKDTRLSAAQSEAVKQILAKWKGAVQPTTPTAVEAAKTPKREPSSAGAAAKEPATPSRSASNGAAAAAAAPAASPKASPPKASPKAASVAKSPSHAAALSKATSTAGANGGLTGADADKRARVQRVLFDALPLPPAVASAVAPATAASAPTDAAPTAAAHGDATAGSIGGATASGSSASAPAAAATGAGAGGKASSALALSGGSRVTLTREELAAAIEAALYDVCGRKVSSEYSEKCRALKFNLSDPQNPDLSHALYRGGITAQRLVTMTAQELAPAALKVLRQKELKDAIDAARSDYDQAIGLGESDMFQCEKCNGTRTQYKMQQTRGADEPMTVFVTCLICGYKWRSGDNN